MFLELGFESKRHLLLTERNFPVLLQSTEAPPPPPRHVTLGGWEPSAKMGGEGKMALAGNDFQIQPFGFTSPASSLTVF